MIHQRIKRENRQTLLHRYTAQLGSIVERNKAELAMLVAKYEAEQAAEQARLAMQEAQAADQAKTSFLANMSHELRTPLNAIIGFSDMMVLLGSENQSKFSEYARNISDSGQHLLELINDILDLAKVESGKLELDESLLDLRETVGSCLVLIREKAQERGLRLSASLPKQLPPLRADERKVKQILINLLSNAVKFTLRGGEVELRIRQDQDGGVLLVVKDSGIGIAAEDIKRALAPFEQVNDSPEVKVEGTGLGLPLTKALVDLHGGSLGIASKVGKGTEVMVRFPRYRIETLAA